MIRKNNSLHLVLVGLLTIALSSRSLQAAAHIASQVSFQTDSGVRDMTIGALGVPMYILFLRCLAGDNVCGMQLLTCIPLGISCGLLYRGLEEYVRGGQTINPDYSGDITSLKVLETRPRGAAQETADVTSPVSNQVAFVRRDMRDIMVGVLGLGCSLLLNELSECEVHGKVGRGVMMAGMPLIISCGILSRGLEGYFFCRQPEIVAEHFSNVPLAVVPAKSLVEGDGFKALNEAMSGEIEPLRALLSAGVEINAIDANGLTALMWVAKRGDVATAQLLLDANALVNGVENEERTALILAADNGHAGMVELLLRAGALVDCVDNVGWTAIMLAADKGHQLIVQLLIDAKAQLDIVNKHGDYALAFAIHKGHQVIINMILDAQSERK